MKKLQVLLSLCASHRIMIFPLVHSVTSHKSAAAFGISCIWLHCPHCLIKTCRWINRNITCNIRNMCSALWFSCGWCQFDVQNQCTKPCPAWEIDSSFFLLQEMYLLLWNIMKFWRLGLCVIGNIDMSKSKSINLSWQSIKVDSSVWFIRHYPGDGCPKIVYCDQPWQQPGEYYGLIRLYVSLQNHQNLSAFPQESCFQVKMATFLSKSCTALLCVTRETPLGLMFSLAGKGI